MYTSDQQNSRESGFTLIELLVSIAIIGVLAAVIMSSLNFARDRGNNTARNNQVREYITALELYKDSNPDEGYPSNRASNPNAYICLGNSTCQNSLTNDEGVNNPTLDEKLQVNINPWIDEKSVPFSGADMKGLAYKCIEPATGDTCDKYSIQWYLVGGDQKCPGGATPFDFLGLITLCRYFSEE